MPRDQLPDDPNALEKWRNMPQNKPSRESLPPVTGGLPWAWVFIALLVIVVLFSLLERGL